MSRTMRHVIAYPSISCSTLCSGKFHRPKLVFDFDLKIAYFDCDNKTDHELSNFVSFVLIWCCDATFLMMYLIYFNEL